MSETPLELFIDRMFNVPRRRLFDAFSTLDDLEHWWGPKDFGIVQHTLNFRSGGVYHYGLAGPGGAQMWGKFVYLDIDAPERIDLVSSFSDAAGGETRHPMAPNWPLRTRSVFLFDIVDPERSRLRTGWSPVDATADERRIFDAAHDGMIAGWTGTLDRLEAYLGRRP